VTAVLSSPDGDDGGGDAYPDGGGGGGSDAVTPGRWCLSWRGGVVAPTLVWRRWMAGATRRRAAIGFRRPQPTEAGTKIL
jgi:hypothetical protein